VETTGRALVTRADADDAAAVRTAFTEGPDTDDELSAAVDHDERTGTVVVHADDFERRTNATVAVVAAGTADAAVAGEAAVVAREIGATIDRIDDVGVANLDRILDQRDRIREDVVVVAVAAGREGRSRRSSPDSSPHR